MTLSSQQFTKVYHLTNNPRFALNPAKVPEDNAFAIHQRTSPGLFVGDPERWINGSGYVRPFVAELSAPLEALRDERWSGEKFIDAEHFDKVKVERVMPTDAYAREQYGSHGWIEDRLGTTFDSEEEIKSTPMVGASMDSVYPFKGYRYDGPDVRAMSRQEQRRHVRRTRQVLKDWQ